MKCHNPTSRYYMILILNILALSNSIQDTKLVGMRNNCLFAPIVPTLPVSANWQKYRYVDVITKIYIFQKSDILLISQNHITSDH